MKKIAYTALALALPFMVSAQPRVGSVQDAGSFLISLINNVAVPVIFALALVVFIWGVFVYFVAGGHNDEQRDKGKKLMLYGILGIFIMVSVWGLVNILVNSVTLDNNGPEKLPKALPTGTR
ncbi:MAG TPA: pilin [Candidatus Paceibacterota bacterium]|jgi:heme/copper-type cytochrome/quinol oxidase subunit 2